MRKYLSCTFNMDMDCVELHCGRWNADFHWLHSSSQCFHIRHMYLKAETSWEFLPQNSEFRLASWKFTFSSESKEYSDSQFYNILHILVHITSGHSLEMSLFSWLWQNFTIIDFLSPVSSLFREKIGWNATVRKEFIAPFEKTPW